MSEETDPDPDPDANPDTGAGPGAGDGEGGEGSGVGALVRALEVPRLAAWGFAIGLVLTVGTFGFFVVLPGAADRSPLLYLGLGFVLALSLGLLLTMVFVAGSAYRLVRSTDLSEPAGAEDLE